MDAILHSRKVLQVAMLVKDIEASARKYAALFGMPMPDILESGDYESTKTEYHGRPTDARCKMAFFNLENVQLELIEPDDNDSNWRDTLNENGEGFHHVAFEIKGMREQIDRFSKNGVALIQKGEYHGGRYAFMDTTPQYHMMLELLEND